MPFELHPNLKNKLFITDLKLSRVLLEDNSHYPWIFLVPRRENISKIMDLTAQDQIQLLHEMDYAQNVFEHLFHPTQINVAAIGNKTPQLHLHIIARDSEDPAWPGTVWDHTAKKPYTEEKREEIIQLLTHSFSEISLNN
ncbi:MAG: hypothetical protein CMO81_07370 [Waddliaceae bacterium]|nr:hypothetical protein [Waddliaceae bacterium]